MMQTIDIGIAEDHPLVREGLVAALRSHTNINIVFEASNGQELLEILKTTRPDILLLDIEMPIMRAPEVLLKINVRYPRIKVIIISAFFQKDYIIECFKLGAKAFLPKADKTEKILEAIMSVYEHGIYTGIEVAKVLAEEIQDSDNKKITEKAELSDTELKVLKLICKGTSRRKAADILNVKPETVAFHMKNILRKTQTENASALATYAIQNKLITL